MYHQSGYRIQESVHRVTEEIPSACSMLHLNSERAGFEDNMGDLEVKTMIWIHFPEEKFHFPNFGKDQIA